VAIIKDSILILVHPNVISPVDGRTPQSDFIAPFQRPGFALSQPGSFFTEDESLGLECRWGNTNA
jgi:hypothetical protein